MKGRKTWERGYAAGIIDGEGCIQIKKVQPTGHHESIEYSLAININMTDKEALDFMVGAFGGVIYFLESEDPLRKSVYRWELTRKKAAPFLKQILPFLRIKNKQAELGIRFQMLREKSTKIYCPKLIDGHYGQRKIPQYLLDQFDAFYLEMRQLKNSGAAVTTKRDDPQLEGSDSLVLQE